MSYRKLLLPLSDSPCGAAALQLGLDLAQAWQAHLSVLVMRVDARSVAPLAGEGLSGAMIEDMMAATERESGDRAVALQQLFADAATAACVPQERPADGTPGATAGLEVV